MVKICPRCGSTNISIPPGGSDILMSVPDFCRECHFYGRFPDIDDDLIDKFKKFKKKPIIEPKK